MVVSIFDAELNLQIILARRFALERSLSAKQADSRIRQTSEVIEGIVSVKSFGWEAPFIALIGSFRALETSHINQKRWRNY